MSYAACSNSVSRAPVSASINIKRLGTNPYRARASATAGAQARVAYSYQGTARRRAEHQVAVHKISLPRRRGRRRAGEGPAERDSTAAKIPQLTAHVHSPRRGALKEENAAGD